MITPPVDQLAEVLQLIDAGATPVPERLADTALYAVVNGLVDLETGSLTENGRRTLAIVGAGGKT